MNLWLLDHPRVSGIFNVGTGASATFNDVARAIIAGIGKGTIRYIPFPPELAVELSELHRGRYFGAARGGLRRAVQGRARRHRELSGRARLLAVSARAKVLVVGPSWVGDMVMAQALYRVLAARVPAPEIHVLAPPWSLPLNDRMPEVSKSIELAAGHGELKLALRRSLGVRLAKEGYAEAIVLPRSLKAALVPWFARIPKRTGFRGEWRYGLLNDVRELDRARLDQTVKRFVALGLDANAAPPTTLSAEWLPRLRVDDANLARLKRRARARRRAARRADAGRRVRARKTLARLEFRVARADARASGALRAAARVGEGA